MLLNYCFVLGEENVADSLVSPCVSSKKDHEFVYQGKSYTVSSSKTDQGYDACKKATDAVVLASQVDQPRQIKTLNFTVYSYYYDRAVDANLIGQYMSSYRPMLNVSNSIK